MSEKGALPRERYCKGCRKVVLGQLRSSGQLTAHPAGWAGSWKRGSGGGKRR